MLLVYRLEKNSLEKNYVDNLILMQIALTILKPLRRSLNSKIWASLVGLFISLPVKCNVNQATRVTLE